MPFAEITGERLFFAARGASGVPLVFIHGAGDNHLLWNGQLAAFADVARAFAIDLPGHGRSSGVGRTSVAEYSFVVREFLHAVHLERAILVGSSMGGAIAQLCALEFPERVLGLGLVGTGAKLRVAPAFLAGLETDFEATARLLVENYFAPGAPSEIKDKSLRQLLATGRDVTWGDYMACNSFDVRERIQDIRAPTLVVCGLDDKMTPLSYSQFLAEKIPNAGQVLVENAGHLVMLEQPAVFNDALRVWITSLHD